jgi:serine/threonine protein kinase
MVMTFIEGETLQSFVKRKGALDYEQAVNYLGQIASAVDYVHSKNFLHRDIKPDNIIITPGYHAILIDFGSARKFEQDKTQAHTAILTVGYAPAEQYDAVSQRGSYTDIYSLGAVYYFALTGVAPLEATKRLLETLTEPSALNSNITDDINRTILKAMAMKPENRHQTVDEFLDDLFGVRPSKPVEDDNVIVITKSRKWMWVTLIAVLVVSGIIVGLMLGNNAQQEKRIALQQEILAATKVVNDSIRSDNVYYMSNDLCYHLFRDCTFLNENAIEGSVQQAFENNVMRLCETCINRVGAYNQSRKEANRFKDFADDLNEDKYYNSALDWCNKALQMRPDNTKMMELKQLIENRK